MPKEYFLTLSYYGANLVAARYVGSSHPKMSVRHWQHGWVYRPSLRDTRDIVGSSRLDRSRIYLVSRDSEASVLNNVVGREVAIPVGLPYCYLPHQRAIRRVEGLLVFPKHSTKYERPANQFDSMAFREYVVRLASENWRQVLVSLPKHDFENPVAREYWQSLPGVRVVRGADIDNPFALYQLKLRLQGISHVVSESFTSAIAYAAYEGCHTSIWKEATPDLILDVQESGQERQIVDNFLPRLREHESWLFADVIDSQKNVEWGAKQIGLGFKLERTQLLARLGWKKRVFFSDFLRVMRYRNY